MIGILIIGYNEKSGPYLDLQIPSLLCELKDIDLSSLKDLYQESRNRMEGPNFYKKEIKENITTYYFYTGYSALHYVGRPGYAIFTLFSDDNEIPELIEGMLRRVAHELLPQKEASTFTSLFQDYYELLKNEELGEFWEEIGEKQDIPIQAIKKMESKIEEDSKDSQQIENIKEEYENKINVLSLEINELKEKTDNLTTALHEAKEESDHKDSVINQLEKEIINLKAIEQESIKQANIINEKTQEIAELKAIVEKSEAQAEELAKLKDIMVISKKQSEDLEKQARELDDLKAELEIVKKENEELQDKSRNVDQITNEKEEIKLELKIAKADLETLKRETNNFLSTITDLKLELKKKKEELASGKQDKKVINDDMINMKKEIKVLRRERDHYKNIVKEKNLL
ncbi:MAG: hypothetical protein ACFFAS_05760 [Promethearchaeota archaeon]